MPTGVVNLGGMTSQDILNLAEAARAAANAAYAAGDTAALNMYNNLVTECMDVYEEMRATGVWVVPAGAGTALSTLAGQLAATMDAFFNGVAGLSAAGAAAAAPVIEVAVAALVAAATVATVAAVVAVVAEAFGAAGQQLAADARQQALELIARRLGLTPSELKELLGAEYDAFIRDGEIMAQLVQGDLARVAALIAKYGAAKVKALLATGMTLTEIERTLVEEAAGEPPGAPPPGGGAAFK
jgi:hypothetical protein